MSRRKICTMLVVFAVVGLTLAGCGRRQAEPSATTAPARQGTAAALRVWIPCGLAGYMEAFSKALTGDGNSVFDVEYEIVNVWGLVEQLASADPKPDFIIMPGDLELKELDAKGQLSEKPVAWAYNQIAVLTPKANPAKLESFTDLAKATKVILSPPSTSTGYYAEQALKKAGLLEKVKKHLIVPETPAEMYRQLADGEAQAALAYAGCAFPAPTYEKGATSVKASNLPAQAPEDNKQRSVIVLGPVPEEYSTPFPACMAIPKDAPHPEWARQALANLLSDEAQADIALWMPKPARETELAKKRVGLHMYCGAGLRPPIEKLAKAFEEKHRNVRLNVSYAGSGCLLAQLTFAKRGDLYMPGEAFYLDQAKKRGFLVEEAQIAYFVPVILVAKGNPKGVKGLEDLLRPDVKVGIGEPEACAVGRVTKIILQRAGLWEKIEKRQQIRRALNVPELAYWVSLGSVDAAVVWQAQAKQFADKCDAVPVPSKYYDPVDISIGLLKFSKNPDMAQRFIQFVSSPEGKAVFREAGYALEPTGK
ncbi:MAG: molybdate ABC transporter substrate-binding protein [Armatimonadota bacterium]